MFYYICIVFIFSSNNPQQSITLTEVTGTEPRTTTENNGNVESQPEDKLCP